MTVVDILLIIAFLAYVTWNEASKRKGKPTIHTGPVSDHYYPEGKEKPQIP